MFYENKTQVAAISQGQKYNMDSSKQMTYILGGGWIDVYGEGVGYLSCKPNHPYF
jgi:hypothetical protein